MRPGTRWTRSTSASGARSRLTPMERSSLPVALPSSDAIGSELMLLAANESSDDQTRPRSAAPSGQQAPELRAKPDLAEAATQNGHETCPRALMAEFPGHQGVPACLASDLSIRLCRNVARNRESPIRAAEEPPAPTTGRACRAHRCRTKSSAADDLGRDRRGGGGAEANPSAFLSPMARWFRKATTTN